MVGAVPPKSWHIHAAAFRALSGGGDHACGGYWAVRWIGQAFGVSASQRWGYTLAPSGAPDLYVGPDAFRALPKYLNQLMADPLGCMLLPMAPKGYPDAWGTVRRWSGAETSPFEKMRVLDPKPDPRKIAKLARDFGAMFPQLGKVEIKAAWAGMIDTMPDIVPVVDHAPIKGVVIGTGMSGHGFGIGPAMGRILADMAAGRSAGYDLSRFRLGRFTDGTVMVPGPNV